MNKDREKDCQTLLCIFLQKYSF